ncbi:MAG: D-alanine--D-alanine ligase family protein [Cyclobacteriaceae bacterium]
MQNLILLCGGNSPEHEISIRSAKNILSALDREKYLVKVIGISKKGQWFLLDESNLGESVPDQGLPVSIRPGSNDCFHTSESSLGDVDVIFPILHGPNGEDGSIQGLIQILDIPFVGPGILGSSLCMDKELTKRILRHEGIKVAEWITLRKGDMIPDYKEMVSKLGSLIFVKPANMGSSVGVSRVSNESDWNDAVNEAFLYDNKVLVEECLLGREIECAVLGNEDPKTSGVGEVQSGEVYSYDEKYDESSSAKIMIPADVSAIEIEALRSTALNSFKALECKGLSRVDMFLDKNGAVFVNEVNTMPGFTSISMYPKLWENEGLGYTELVNRLIELAVANHE